MELAGGHGVTSERLRPSDPLWTGGRGAWGLSAANPCPLSAGACDRPPNFLSPSGSQALAPALGSAVTLNCTAWVVPAPLCPLLPVQWLKDGLPLGNGSHYELREDSW